MTMRLPRAFILFGSIVAMVLSGCIAPAEGDLPQAVDEDREEAIVVAHEAFEGKLVCGVGTPGGTLNPCLLVHGSKNVVAFSIKPGVQTLLVGLTWEATTLLGEDLQLLVESRGFNSIHSEDTTRYGSASGGADLVVRVDASDLTGTEWSWDDLTSGLDLQARVFPARTMPPNVVLEQPFAIHVATFYGAVAPDDATPFDAGNGTA